ncbi:MAG: spore cortex-lytic enzyme [Limnochordia bacterium]
MLRRASGVVLLTVILVLCCLSGVDPRARATLYWGSRGSDVRTLQWRLSQWGYYRGAIDGVFGAETAAAVREFQRKNGLPVDGLVGPATWVALGLGSSTVSDPTTSNVSYGASSQTLLARVVAAEARNEPYEGQVAVAAVILNRVADPRFPNTLAGVVYQPHAFESVTNGLVWTRTPTSTEQRAARDALTGWDPSYGALFFWNPAKPVSSWIWTRPIVTRIGNHVFAH